MTNKSEIQVSDFQPAVGQPVYVDGESIGTVQTVRRIGNGYQMGVALFDSEKHADYATVKTTDAAVVAEIEPVKPEDEAEVVDADGVKPDNKNATVEKRGTK